MHVFLKYHIMPWVIVCVLSVFHPAGLSGQDTTVQAVLDTNRALIGDQLKMRLIVEKPVNVMVSFPEIEDKLTDEIEVIRKSDIDTSLLSEGFEKLQQELLIAVFDTGFFVIPSLPFVVQSGQVTDTLKASPAVLEIASIPLEAEIRDIKANYNAPLTLAELLPYILAVVVLITAVWLARSYYKRKYKGLPVALANQNFDPPDVAALNELEKLKVNAPWLHNQIKPYYIRLSEIVRNYIEQQFHVMALELTTEEIIHGLKNVSGDEQSLKLLSKLLSLADLVKFAKVMPDKVENAKQIDFAVEFIQRTRNGILPEDQANMELKPEMLKETSV